VIRAATVEDLPAILAIYNHAVLHTTATADHTVQTPEARRAWFDEHIAQGLPVIVFVDADKVIGWGALNRYHTRFGYRFSVENSVYVDEAARGRGVGRALLEELIGLARRLGLHVMVASVDATNPASLQLHKRFGFVEAGRLREVYQKFDRWLDVIYLQLLL
jgi:L-amino acid N-acyltransferase YncA